MDEDQAVERFARTVAAAAEELVDTLKAEADQRDPLDEISPPLGPVQRRIMGMERASTRRGIGTADVLREMDGRGGPQMLQVLETLERRGLLERIAESSPPRFRVVAPYRQLAGGTSPPSAARISTAG